MSASADQKLEQITGWLKENLKPTKLYLYGSRSNGTARADSDYDFVALVPGFNKANRYELMWDLQRKSKAALGIDIQVWAYSEDDFNDWVEEFGSIPETAVNTGREIELG